MDKEQLARALIKPLVWDRRDDHHWAADAIHRTVYITEYAGMSEPFQLNMRGYGSPMFATLDDAKAAAEADYLARMSAALNLDAVAALLARAEAAEAALAETEALEMQHGAVIERLTKECRRFENDAVRYNNQARELRGEVARLTAENEALCQRVAALDGKKVR